MIAISLPLSYYVALLITLIATAFGILNIRRTWSLPFLAVVATFAMWYLVEPITTPETMVYFSQQYLEMGYEAAALFILSFILAFFSLLRRFRPRGLAARQSIRETMLAPSAMPPDRLAMIAIGFWLALLAYGTFRLNGDIVQALFPISSRAGASMWRRAAGADAGSTGFIVSSAAYLYILALALLGVLLPLVRKRSVRALLLLAICLAWPYAFLQGSRNITLAVTVPMFGSILLFTRLSLWIKGLIAIVGIASLNFALLAIVSLRNTGFSVSGLDRVDGQQHLGLNMGSELIWATSFIDSGVLRPSWGLEYLSQVLNFVPRAIWPGKPMVGIDYAIARGFGGAVNDIGVNATISTGMVGQGVLNFGVLLGPIVAGVLLAIWANILHRLRLQGTAPRVALFLVGLALTFNLGRDVTLLVLFPFVFGYLIVWALQLKHARKRSHPGHRAGALHLGGGRWPR